MKAFRYAFLVEWPQIFYGCRPWAFTAPGIAFFTSILNYADPKCMYIIPSTGEFTMGSRAKANWICFIIKYLSWDAVSSQCWNLRDHLLQDIVGTAWTRISPLFDFLGARQCLFLSRQFGSNSPTSVGLGENFEPRTWFRVHPTADACDCSTTNP